MRGVLLAFMVSCADCPEFEPTTYLCSAKMYCDQGTYAFRDLVVADTWDDAVEGFQAGVWEWLGEQSFSCGSVKLVGVECRTEE